MDFRMLYIRYRVWWYTSVVDSRIILIVYFGSLTGAHFGPLTAKFLTYTVALGPLQTSPIIFYSSFFLTKPAQR
jgi:hypothetical protein